MSGTSVGYSWSGSLITTTDARMRAWDLASQIRRARRLARRHTVIACRSAFESSRSRCWAGCIMSTDWKLLRETGHGIGRRLFLRITGVGSAASSGGTAARGVLVRLRDGVMQSLPWAWTDLPMAAAQPEAQTDDRVTVLLSPRALRELVRRVRELRERDHGASSR